MSDAIVVTNLSKRFLLPSIPRGATVKDLVLRTVRRDGNRDTYVDALRNVSFSVERGSMLGVTDATAGHDAHAAIADPEAGFGQSAGRATWRRC